MRLAVETVEAVKVRFGFPLRPRNSGLLIFLHPFEQWMHEQKIYHNDLKPANILLDRSKRVKIADFGLASFDEPK